MSLNKAKSNAILGKEVNEHLTKLGINTPMIQNNLTDQEKIDKITASMADILETLGIDLTDDSLEETPMRVAKMYVNEIFSGLKDEAFPKCTTVDNKFSHGEEFVLVKDIQLYSDCEHHIRPIKGKVNIAYIPKDKVLGLSKLNRIVEYFGQRPQVQERLNAQIAHAVSYIIGSDDVIVSIDAEHFCVSQRGVKHQGSSTQTLTALGVFSEPGSSLRKEFNSSI